MLQCDRGRCDPGSEDSNGLLRDCMRRGTDLGVEDADQITEIQARLATS